MALLDWERAPAEARASFDARLLKARLLIQHERGPEAIALLTALRAEASEERMKEILLSLGLAQSVAKMFKDAEATLRAARAKGADGDLVDAAIGEVLLASGRKFEAELLLRQVLRRAPDLVGPMMNLAVLRASEGNLTEAAALIRQAWAYGHQDLGELRRTPEFARIRELGLLNDLFVTSEARCRIY
ncbi:hypothetical protein ACN47A_19490 [Myxococcus fulvus]|uniref:hypothetical protein n=1 Tax=Myxococcus fulvus TaxID=33 RepID=UPI003B9D0D59